jgi:hypothetical protein
MTLLSKRPVIDIFIGRDGPAWRLYVAPSSWKPGYLGEMDAGSVFPVGQPNVAALDRLLRRVGTPVDRRQTGDGGVEILATGRAAVAVAAWLAELVDAGRGTSKAQTRGHA